jgi:SAM-dependent methyltransferase
MEDGVGVDEIQNIHNINMPNESVGWCISCDTFEHVEYPQQAISELHRILMPGGFLILTSVMLYPIHAAPYDYWRFTPDGFRSLLKQFKASYVDWNGKERNPHTVVGIARKGQYCYDNLINRKSEWAMIKDITTNQMLFEYIVSCKKKIFPKPFGN